MSPIQFAVRPAVATTADPRIVELRQRCYMLVGNTGASPARTVALAADRTLDYYVDYPVERKHLGSSAGAVARLAMGNVVPLDTLMPAFRVVQRLLAGSFGLLRDGQDPFGYLPTPALLCDITCLHPNALDDIERTASLLGGRMRPDRLPKAPAARPVAMIAAMEQGVESAIHEGVSLAAFEAQHPADGRRIAHLLLARSAENHQVWLDVPMRRSLRRFAKYAWAVRHQPAHRGEVCAAVV